MYLCTMVIALNNNMWIAAVTCRITNESSQCANRVPIYSVSVWQSSEKIKKGKTVSSPTVIFLAFHRGEELDEKM